MPLKKQQLLTHSLRTRGPPPSATLASWPGPSCLHVCKNSSHPISGLWNGPVILRQNIFLFDICLAKVVSDHSLLCQEIIAKILSKFLTVCFIGSPVPEQYTVIMKSFAFLPQKISVTRNPRLSLKQQPGNWGGAGPQTTAEERSPAWTVPAASK